MKWQKKESSTDRASGWLSRMGLFAPSGAPLGDELMTEAQFVEKIKGRRVGLRDKMPDVLKGLIFPLNSNDFI